MPLYMHNEDYHSGYNYKFMDVYLFSSELWYKV